MTQRVVLQPALVLHARAFRDTSLIVDLFTPDYGKLSAIARGARTQRSKFRGVLQAFIPLVVSWSGRSELVTLQTAEPNAPPYPLGSEALLSALYINELMVRLLAAHDPHPELFSAYQRILSQLQSPPISVEVSLREFEKRLLESLGYGVDWFCEAESGEAIDPQRWYVFVPDRGFLPADRMQGTQLAVSGAHIVSIGAEDWSDAAVLRSAKQLMRAAMQPLLHGKPIRTRELFI